MLYGWAIAAPVESSTPSSPDINVKVRAEHDPRSSFLTIGHIHDAIRPVRISSQLGTRKADCAGTRWREPARTWAQANRGLTRNAALHTPADERTDCRSCQLSIIAGF